MPFGVFRRIYEKKKVYLYKQKTSHKRNYGNDFGDYKYGITGDCHQSDLSEPGKDHGRIWTDRAFGHHFFHGWIRDGGAKPENERLLSDFSGFGNTYPSGDNYLSGILVSLGPQLREVAAGL